MMPRLTQRLLAVAVLVILAHAAPATAQDVYLGEIRMFAGDFAPVGWQFCDGQLMAIAENTQLFSLISNTYGGDGISTFRLPDLRGRFPLHAADGPGLPPRARGEAGGAASSTPLNMIGLERGYQPGEVAGLSGPSAHAVAAGGTTDDRMPPFLGIKFIIAVQGIYPARPQ